MEQLKQKPFARALFLIGILLGIVIGVLVSKRLFEPMKESTKARSALTESHNKKRNSLRKEIRSKAMKPVSFQDSMLLMIDSLDRVDKHFFDSIAREEYDSNDSYWSWEDTLKIDEMNANNSFEEEEGLATDELIAVKFIQPSGNKSDFSCDTYDELDSLLMDYKKPRDRNDMRVEFWKSPLNFKGYILTRSKLALYGIYQINDVKLEYLEDGKIKLMYRNEFFILKCTDKFIPFR